MRFDSLIGFGVAGNFTGHLEQAGEIDDFKRLVLDDPNAPKGLFPFYLPGHPTSSLARYPIDHDKLTLPADGSAVQAEPEVALLCRLTYDEQGSVCSVIPYAMTAFNDASIRRPGAAKISHKKQWGSASKGVATRIIPLDSLNIGGTADGYRLACWLKRKGRWHAYGIDSPISGYSYNHTRLLAWITDRLRTQQDEGPLEAISTLLIECGHPRKALITIGATRYTDFGETGYLQPEDELAVILYPASTYGAADLSYLLDTDGLGPDVSLLRQRVC